MGVVAPTFSMKFLPLLVVSLICMPECRAARLVKRSPQWFPVRPSPPTDKPTPTIQEPQTPPIQTLPPVFSTIPTVPTTILTIPTIPTIPTDYYDYTDFPTTEFPDYSQFIDPIDYSDSILIAGRSDGRSIPRGRPDSPKRNKKGAAAVVDEESKRDDSDPGVPAGPKTQVEVTPSMLDVEIELMPDAPQNRNVTVPQI